MLCVAPCAQSCLIPCDPTDCSSPGSSVHRIIQARILSGLPFPSPGDLPDPGIEPSPHVLQADSLLSEPPEKPPIKLSTFKKENYSESPHHKQLS